MDGHFIYVKIGDFGSMHDANCFQRTNLWQNVHLFFSEDENILADSAYSDRAFCVTPYPLHAQMHDYNFEHSRLRVIVEHAFSRLKQNWSFCGTKLRCQATYRNAFLRACFLLENRLHRTKQEFA